MKQGMKGEKFILRHWWIYVILKNSELESLNFKSIKAGSYSEVTLCKMIQDLKHLKRQPQKSWTLYQDYRVVQDKLLMQYPLIPRWNWKMLTNCWKFQNRSVQTFEFVYHDTNGQNHAQVWKTQSFLLSEICTVILKQDCHVKSNLRKSFFLARLGESFQLGMSLCTSSKRIILVCVCGWHKNWLERNKTLIRCAKSS